MTKKDYGSVTFEDNSKARAVGISSISFTGSTQVDVGCGMSVRETIKQ